MATRRKRTGVEGTKQSPYLRRPKTLWEKRLFDKCDEIKAKKLSNHYLSEAESCDLCGSDLKQSLFFVDGILMNSMMGANMCPACFFERGQGIGWGRGQLYIQEKTRKWLMIAGFPPEDEYQYE